jgi:hypothetical protein
LQLPPIPAAVAYLWEWFREVQNGDRLKWQELSAWSKLSGKDISSIEAQAIRSLSFIQFHANNSTQ